MNRWSRRDLKDQRGEQNKTSNEASLGKTCRRAHVESLRRIETKFAEAKPALKTRVRQDGKWQGLLAREPVPGGGIRLRPGDMIPADTMVFYRRYPGICLA
jgi:magnesium-transporting ATPase (P-type)